MPNRKNDIDALIARSERDFAAIRTAYDQALHEQAISAELRIDIKNLFENLRSALDYLAKDIREKHCPTANQKARFYFPILPDVAQYQKQMDVWFPGLRTTCPD